MHNLLGLLLATTLMLGAQAPADTNAYTVAYFDVNPASKAAAVSPLPPEPRMS